MTDQAKGAEIAAVVGFHSLTLLIRALAVYRSMEKAGYSVNDLADFISFRTKAAVDAPLRTNIQRCPDCGAALKIAPIKEPKGRGNVHGYKSRWFCDNDDCAYEKLNLEKAQESIIIRQNKVIEYDIPDCPDCQKPLMLKHICTPKGRANVHGYQSQWLCQNKGCLYEKYNYEDMNEIMEELKK